jgi:hypothetical protein
MVALTSCMMVALLEIDAPCYTLNQRQFNANGVARARVYDAVKSVKSAALLALF